MGSAGSASGPCAEHPLCFPLTRSSQPSGSVPCGNLGQLSVKPCGCLWLFPPHSSVELLSCVRLCDPTDCSTPGFPVLQQVLELAQTHVHRVSDAFQPSHSVVPFSSCLQSFPASGYFPMSQFFTSSGRSIRASPSVLVRPMNSGLISFRIDLLDLCVIQGTLTGMA